MRRPVVFGACVAGMGLGLVLDCRDVEPEALASLCSSATGFASRLQAHWRLMPATHWGMVLAAVAAIGAQCVRASPGGRVLRSTACLRETLCLCGMTLGMAKAMDHAPVLAPHVGSAFIAMVLSMLAGMATGAGGASLLWQTLRWPADRVVHALVASPNCHKPHAR